MVWTQCCDCKKMIKAPNSTQWYEGIIPEGERVSHGYCTKCYEKAKKEFEKAAEDFINENKKNNE